jgi:hypothetical protein
MNKPIAIFISIIVLLLVFVLGGGIGILYQTRKDAPLLEKAAQSEGVIKNLSSKTVLSIVAYGQVTNIQGRDITLTYAGDTLTVRIKENSMIYSLVTPSTTQKGAAAAPTQQKAEFKDIKKGDNLNVTLRLLPDGQLEASVVMIMSSLVKTK